ncbi:MAG TPA: response regulator [bacterium]|nr:response regulator [bacterium]
MTDYRLQTTDHRSLPAGGQIAPLSGEPPTVFVVDDDASFLESIGRLLRASRYQVKTFSSAENFLAQIPAGARGCVLADLHMPGMNGLELQQSLARLGNPLPVVFLTGQGDIRTSVQAMRQGAEDFLTKLAPKAELLNAVQQALAREERERKTRQQQAELRNRFEELTGREMEVLKHVVQGRLNKEIAADLGISERTVKLHRTAITTKLGVPSVAELTKLWIAAGFAEDK